MRLIKHLDYLNFHIKHFLSSSIVCTQLTMWPNFKGVQPHDLDIFINTQAINYHAQKMEVSMSTYLYCLISPFHYRIMIMMMLFHRTEDPK